MSPFSWFLLKKGEPRKRLHFDPAGDLVPYSKKIPILRSLLQSRIHYNHNREEM